MLQIPCPWCGQRDEKEFSYGGAAHIVRPPLSASDEEWADYLFNRENPKGIYRERWAHSYGCGRWLNMLRDTVSHEIHATYKMGDEPPYSATEQES